VKESPPSNGDEDRSDAEGQKSPGPYNDRSQQDIGRAGCRIAEEIGDRGCREPEQPKGKYDCDDRSAQIRLRISRPKQRPVTHQTASI